MSSSAYSSPEIWGSWNGRLGQVVGFDQKSPIVTIVVLLAIYWTQDTCLLFFIFGINSVLLFWLFQPPSYGRRYGKQEGNFFEGGEGRGGTEEKGDET